jgi:hypothetical protein
MRLSTWTTIALAAAVVLATWPAEAAPKKRTRYEASSQPRSATRITVRKARSYLDPGTEVLPYTRQYTDYALPPMGSPLDSVDPTRSYRAPLPDYFSLPGYARYW